MNRFATHVIRVLVIAAYALNAVAQTDDGTVSPAPAAAETDTVFRPVGIGTTAPTVALTIDTGAVRAEQNLITSQEYDHRVAGVVSAEPGVILGVAGDSKEMVATTGRVKVNVDATRSAIRVGDLLVTSARPGVAMKSEPVEINGRRFHQPGTIIGKALEPLASGIGEILVLLSLQ